MEQQEGWSLCVKAYVSLFKHEVLEDVRLWQHRSLMRDWRLEADSRQFVDAGLIRCSRQLRYMLSQLTTDGARLVVCGNVGMNGLGTWRLLSIRFSLPTNCPKYQSTPRLTKV